ncbi:MAG: hypothetical protein ACSHX6_15610 [Akkermansiaceae bacterium]
MTEKQPNEKEKAPAPLSNDKALLEIPHRNHLSYFFTQWYHTHHPQKKADCITTTQPALK